jgi:hypothetical protein
MDSSIFASLEQEHPENGDGNKLLAAQMSGTFLMFK